MTSFSILPFPKKLGKTVRGYCVCSRVWCRTAQKKNLVRNTTQDNSFLLNSSTIHGSHPIRRSKFRKENVHEKHFDDDTNRLFPLCSDGDGLRKQKQLRRPKCNVDLNEQPNPTQATGELGLFLQAATIADANVDHRRPCHPNAKPGHLPPSSLKAITKEPRRK